MPPKNKFTKDEILDTAFEIVRKHGMAALTARSLAEKLNCSVKPIFGMFKNMDELQQAVTEKAGDFYREKIYTAMRESKELPYKASGLAYIRFAKDEPELFKLGFMCDRSKTSAEKIDTETPETKVIIELLENKLGLSHEDACRFHLENWVYVHGIATMIATGFLDWDDDFIDSSLSDCYAGLKYRFCGEDKD